MGLGSVLRWGIISAGNISHQFATAFSALPSEEHVLMGVAARSLESAMAFAVEFEVPKAYGSYEELVKDPDIDVVYIGSINTQHLPLGKLALENGKHVLCEKPLCINARETKELVGLAQSKGLFLMEAIWSRFFPCYQRLKEEIDKGSIGEVLQVMVTFGVDLSKKDRVMLRKLGGGGILDIGVYNVQLATFVLGGANGIRPVRVKSSGHLNNDGVDESNSAVLIYEGAKVATLITHTRVDLPNEAVIVGTKGTLKVHKPFWRATSLTLANGEVVDFPQPLGKDGQFNKSMGLSYQCREVKRCIDAKQIESKTMSHSESVIIAEIMEDMRKQMGVTYEQD